MPTNAKPITTQSPGPSQHSGQPSVQSHEIPPSLNFVFDIPQPGVSDNSCGSSRKTSSDEPSLTLVILAVRTVHADDHRAAPTLYVRTENLTFEEAERRIDEIAKVVQLAISPSGSDQISVLGARARKFKAGGEGYH